MMRYGEITGLNKPVSRILLGGSSNPMRRGENCDEILDSAFQSGINTIDTARGYGESERIIGDWIERKGIRNKVVIQTKGALHGLLGNTRVKEKCIRSDLEKSLQALKVDCVDIYLLHRDNPKTDVAWIVELLNEFKTKGKVTVFGVSNWHSNRIEQANEYAYKHNLTPLSVSQPHFSLAEAGRWTWIDCLSVTGAKNAQSRAWYAQTNFPLMAFSPLGGGFLSGKVKSADIKNTKRSLNFAMKTTFLSKDNVERLKRVENLSAQTGYAVASLALAWILQQDMNTFAVSGCSRKESLQKSLAALEITLTKEQLAYLNLERADY